MTITLHMLAFVSGFLLDCLFGDPYWMPHPVRFMGNLISFLDKKLMGEKHKGEEKKADAQNGIGIKDDATIRSESGKGILLVICVLAATAIVSGIIFLGAYAIHPIAGFVVEAIMTYQILAARCLQKESTKVYTALKKNDLLGARYAVSMIVGRDTNVLDEAGVARAAVETVAESTSDGVIAPMLYTALGGPVLGMIYKAVNTMDSMVGYKSSRYLYFGRAAAKLDDVINWVPARISALLLIAGSAFLSVTRIFSKEKAVYNTKDAWHIWRRDAKKHASPNAGHTEAACAGVLGIRLAGDTIYGSKVIKKPYIGDDKRAVLPEDICRCNYLMYAAAVLGEVICVILMILLNFIG